MSWGPDNDGFWDVTTNWIPVGLPGAADDVTIDVGGATVRTITQRSGTDTVSSLASQENIAVTGGSLTVANAYTNANGTSLSSGALNLNGVSTLSTLTQSGGPLGGTGGVVVTGNANISGGDMQGAATTTLQGTTTLTNLYLDGGRTLSNSGTVNWGNGSLNLNNNINGTSVAGFGTVTNAGVWNDALNVNTHSISATSFGGSDTGAGAAFNNQWIYAKTGSGSTTISTQFNNTGTVDVQAGSMNLQSGIQGTTGAINIGSSGTVTLGANSTVGTLNHSGGAAGSLALGSNNVTVSNDYNNANFGVGNAFNARANISGTGQINVAGTPGLAQVLSGANLPNGSSLANGNTATPTLTIGNVHVGGTTFNYQIENNNLGGPAIRGAIQTSANGGHLTDGRLSGTGVAASNWAPIAAGGNSGNLGVTLNVATAGVYAPLFGQSVALVNNFGNVADQVLAINSSAGAAAYDYANIGLSKDASGSGAGILYPKNGR